MLYYYKAKVLAVHDGDTITANIDLGLLTWVMDQKIRLYGINAPELRGATKAAGIASRDFLDSLLNGKEVHIETRKDKKCKFGRWLGTIWVPVEEDSQTMLNVNQRMINAGHAIKFMDE